MSKYFKNENVYKLPNRHIHSSPRLGHVTQFWWKYVKGQGHTGTTYTAKICLDSVPGGPIKFVLGGWH